MEHLAHAGIERFIVNTHYLSHMYMRYFPDNTWRNIPIIFRHEPVLLDTAGGLKNIEDLLGHDEVILCYNGDIVTDLPLERLIRAHEEKRPEVTLALRSTGPLLNVRIERSGEVCDMRNMLGNHGFQSCLFTGIYAVETALFRHFDPGVQSIVPVLVERIREQYGSVRGIIVDDGQWCDVGSVAEFETLKKHLENG